MARFSDWRRDGDCSGISEAKGLATDQQPVAVLFLPDLEVFDFGGHDLSAVHGLGGKVVAHEGDVAGQRDLLVEYLQLVEGAFARFDIGDEGFFVLNKEWAAARLTWA